MTNMSNYESQMDYILDNKFGRLKPLRWYSTNIKNGKTRHKFLCDVIVVKKKLFYLII
jgi:hypothetical protein